MPTLIAVSNDPASTWSTGNWELLHQTCKMKPYMNHWGLKAHFKLPIIYFYYHENADGIDLYHENADRIDLYHENADGIDYIMKIYLFWRIKVTVSKCYRIKKWIEPFHNRFVCITCDWLVPLVGGIKYPSPPAVGVEGSSRSAGSSRSSSTSQSPPSSSSPILPSPSPNSPSEK